MLVGRVVFSKRSLDRIVSAIRISLEVRRAP
jgi:hypothetical protein